MRRSLILSVILVSAVAYGQGQEGAAKVRFNKGRDLFIAKQFAPALAEFRAAAELYESPNTRLYIGRCERELGHLATASVELERAASEAADRAASDPRYAATQNAAKQEATEVAGKLGHVTIDISSVPEGGSVTLNGTEVSVAALGVPAPVDPGQVEVIAKAPGYVTVQKTVTVAAGDSIDVEIKLQKVAAPHPTTPTTATTSSSDDKTSDTPPESETPSTGGGHGARNAGLVIGSIGLAGIGVFTAFAVAAQNRFNDLKAACNGPCAPTFQSQIDEGQTYQTVANVALVAGGTAVATGVILLIVAAASGGKAATPATEATITPLVGGGWLAGITHSF
jgi:hypothetical protein